MKLLDAILSEDLEEVKNILIEDPPVIDERNEEAVPMSFIAAETGNLPIIKYIVEYSRASMNETDALHRNILHYAAGSGNLELIKYLVEKVGMSPVSGDKNLETPYDIVHRKGYKEAEAYFAGHLGFSYDNTYRNPVRAGMFPDPSIVRVGEDYYMVNSSFIFFPCIPISHSRDLVNWEIIGHAITNPQWAHLDELEGGRGYWAPDISYYEGRFYIAATYRLNDTGTVYRKQMVVSSDQPGGPYSEPVFLDEDGIDPSIFNDEDGRRYMLLNRGARIFELNKEATKQISEAVLLFYGDQKRAPEGPHLLKKDGYYYLFEAEGGTGPGHRITVSRCKTLMGNYEPCPYNPIMRQQEEGAAIQRCGHGKPVCTQNGEWYMVYLCGRMVNDSYSILGRETALDPITWTADGWPLVNQLKGPSVLQKRPDLPIPAGKRNENKEGSAQKEEGLFTDGKLSCEWVTPRPPVEDGITVQNDRVLIKGSKLPLSDVGSRNILLRRQKDFCFRAVAGLLWPELSVSQEAGMICYYDENTWVSCGLIKEKDGYYIQVKEHIGEKDLVHGKVLLADDEKGRELSDESSVLRLEVETRYLQRTFAFTLDGERSVIVCLDHVYYLCDEGLRKGKRFTGAMTGMYAYAGAEELTAQFTGFSYENSI